jgi:hypothetical protein
LVVHSFFGRKGWIHGVATTGGKRQRQILEIPTRPEQPGGHPGLPFSPEIPLRAVPTIPGGEAIEACEAIAGLVRIKLKGLEKKTLDAGFLYGFDSDEYKDAKLKYDDAFKKLYAGIQEANKK